MLSTLKLAHILLAFLALGPSLTFPLWRLLAEREPAHLPFVLRGIKWIDRRVAIPAYLLLFVTGLALALLLQAPLTQGWLWTAIAIYVAALALGYLVFGPAVRVELAALERGGPADPAYRRARARSNALTVATVAMVLAIVFLMVAKPY